MAFLFVVFLVVYTFFFSFLSSALLIRSRGSDLPTLLRILPQGSGLLYLGAHCLRREEGMFGGGKDCWGGGHDFSGD